MSNSTFKNPGKPLKRSRKPMKRGKLRSVSKRPKRQAEKEDDIIWSIAIKKRDQYTCQYCGTQGNWINPLQAHHIFSRRIKSTRQDMRNGVCLCSQCHDGKAHGRPRKEFKDWLIRHMGEKEYERLRADAMKGKETL